MRSPSMQHSCFSNPLEGASRVSWRIILLAILSLGIAEASATTEAAIEALPSAVSHSPSDWIEWDELPPIPDELGVAGAYVGVSNGALIVAGGSNFPTSLRDGGEKTYRDAIFVLEPGDTVWRNAGRLLHPMAHGAAANVGGRLICVGGRNATQVFDLALELTWNSRDGIVEVQTLPQLPQPCYELSAAAIGPTLYVAAGRDDAGPMHRFWRMQLSSSADRASKLSAWEVLPVYPEPSRYGTALVAQSDGDHPCLFLIGGKEGQRYLNRIDRFNPSIDSRHPWQKCADMPRPAYLPAAAPYGQSHLFIFSGSSGKQLKQLGDLDEHFRFPRNVLAYHTITDTWAHVADLPQGLAAASAVNWNGGLAIPTGEIAPGRRTPKGLWGQVQAAGHHYFGWFDYTVIVGYMAAMAAIGVYFSNKNRNTADFFLGGRKIPWWAAGLSLLATQVSSIGAMAIPAKSYATNWIYITGIASWFVVVPIVTNLFIPVFRRLNVTSAYEYLEARFSPSLRLFGSVTYCLLQLGRMAIVLYLPALALASVTGFDVIAAVLVMGVAGTIYTMAGGMQAVIWTDVLQTGVLVGGILLCLVSVVWQLDGGLTEFFTIANTHQKFQIVHFRWDAFHSALWVVVIGNVFIRLSVFTSDQAVVQRYMTTRDERQSCIALWTSVAVSIPWALLVFSLGTALFVYYRAHPHLLGPTVETDGIVPFFIAQQLPAGLSGIVMAAIMASAMSDLESSMHSIATLLVTDVYSYLRPAATDAARLWAARAITALLGVFGTVSAVVLALANVYSLWDFFQYLMGLFVGSLAGLFMLGAFTTRANSRGALVGALASAALLAFITQYTQIHFLLYAALGILSCFGIGYLASLLLPGRSQTDGLTAFTLTLQG